MKRARDPDTKIKKKDEKDTETSGKRLSWLKEKQTDRSTGEGQNQTQRKRLRNKWDKQPGI